MSIAVVVLKKKKKNRECDLAVLICTSVIIFLSSRSLLFSQTHNI